MRLNFFKILSFLIYFNESLVRELFSICGVCNSRAALIKLKKVSVLSREKMSRKVGLEKEK